MTDIIKIGITEEQEQAMRDAYEAKKFMIKATKAFRKIAMAMDRVAIATYEAYQEYIHVDYQITSA